MNSLNCTNLPKLFKNRYFLIFALVCVQSCLTLPSSSNDTWHVIPGTRFEIEAGRIDQINLDVLDKAESFRAGFENLYFPTADRNRVFRLVAYANQHEYDLHDSSGLVTYARTNVAYPTIHISNDAPDFVWKHELSHAILIGVRSDAPYWIQEGIALFLQDRDPSHKYSCANPEKIRIPVFLLPHLAMVQGLKNIDLPLEKEYLDETNPTKQMATAGYFFLYLWHRKQFLTFLENYGGKSMGVTTSLVNGNLTEWRALLRDFESWLGTLQGTERIPGC